MYFNPIYQHLADELSERIGLAQLAESVEVLGDAHTGVADKNKNIRPSHGTSKEYRIAKLKGDHPDIATRLVDGEFKISTIRLNTCPTRFKP